MAVPSLIVVVEEEKKRRLEVEKQLAALKKEKEDAMAKVIAERDSQAEATKKAGKYHHRKFSKVDFFTFILLSNFMLTS